MHNFVGDLPTHFGGNYSEAKKKMGGEKKGEREEERREGEGRENKKRGKERKKGKRGKKREEERKRKRKKVGKEEFNLKIQAYFVN